VIAQAIVTASLSEADPEWLLTKLTGLFRFLVDRGLLPHYNNRDDTHISLSLFTSLLNRLCDIYLSNLMAVYLWFAEHSGLGNTAFTIQLSLYLPDAFS
jgi:hypothetical protein